MNGQDGWMGGKMMNGGLMDEWMDGTARVDG